MSRKVRIRYLESPAEIPKFRDEAEEARFWATHSLAEILDQLRPVRLRLGLPLASAARERKSAAAALSIDSKLLDQARRIARRKAVSYRTLIRNWIAEGIRRETRGGR